MAKNPDRPKKPGKTPKSRAHRPDVQPIGPALAELLTPAINRGESGVGSSTGLQPPPDNSWDRRAGGEAAAHRARASTRDKSEDVARRDASDIVPDGSGGGSERAQGLEEASQAHYRTSAMVPKLDPELALRASANRFRGRVQAGVDLAASRGQNWNDLAPDEQLAYYAQARMNE